MEDLVEHYIIYVDKEKWLCMTLHSGSSLKLLVEEARMYVNKQLRAEELQVGSFYLNVEQSELHFYTGTLPETWTL